MPPRHGTPANLPATTRATLGALVLDADDGIRLALRSLLEDIGYVVSDARTWKEARGYLRSHPGVLVLLLDVSLPRPRDVVLLQRLLHRMLTSTAPTKRHGLVLLSTNPAYALGRALGLALALGVPVVSKPFEIDDLLLAVARATRLQPPGMPMPI